MFLHIQYHPRGIMRPALRKIFNETLGEVIKNPLIIAVSRPKNLREMLCKSALSLVEGNNPSDFLNEIAGAANQT